MTDDVLDRRLPQPTEAELNILNALWRLGPSTVRRVHEEISKLSDLGYTSVLKLLQIMFQKGLVSRDDSQRAHVYTPALSKQDTQRQLTDDLVRRAFGGSMSELVLQALGHGEAASADDLAAIREMLDRIERGDG